MKSWFVRKNSEKHLKKKKLEVKKTSYMYQFPFKQSEGVSFTIIFYGYLDQLEHSTELGIRTTYYIFICQKFPIPSFSVALFKPMPTSPLLSYSSNTLESISTTSNERPSLSPKLTRA